MRHTERIGLLGGGAVSSINVDKKIAQSEGMNNIPGRINGLVREDRHHPQKVVCPFRLRVGEEGQRLWYALIHRGVIKFVQAVITEKILQGLAMQDFVSIGQGSTH